MLASLVLSVGVAAWASPSYAAARDGAEHVRNLGRFLEQYVGDCDSDDPAFDKRACEAAAAEVRKRYQGKILKLEIEELEGVLNFAAFDQKKGAFRLHLVPFFGERALALSVGRPKRINDDGGPILDNLPIWVKQPDGKPELIFKRELERGMFRLEILVKPKGAYRMKRKGDTDLKGAEVQLVGLRLYPSQGDQPLAEQMY